MRRAILAALFTPLLVTPAAAQTSATQTFPAASPLSDGTLPDSPRDIVVTATRIPTPAADIAAGVTVIDRQTIEERGYTTLVDALSAVPGMRIVQSGGPGSVASVFMRGTNSNQVLVLRDGVPINDPADPGGAYNFGEDTLDDIERIEVIRGPMSGLYGSGAIGGVINLITKRGEGAPHGSVTVAGGLPRSALLGANLSGASGAFDYNLAAQSLSERGFDNTPQRESAYTGERDGFRSQVGSIDLGYTPVDGTRISLYLRGRRNVYGYDDVGFPAFDDPNETGLDSNWFGRLGVTSKLFGGVWETSLFLTRTEDDRRYTNLLDPNDPNQAAEDSRYHGRRTDLQWNNTVHLPDWGIATGSAVTFGAEHIADGATVRVNSTTGGVPYLSSTIASETSDAGHAGLQTTVFKRVTLSGDLREEAVQGVGSATTWRVGASLAVPELLSHLKASYGTAFLAPSLFDRFGVDSDGYLGNPALKPERSQGWEVGWTVDLPGFGRKDFASATVTYFNNRVHDLIETQFSPSFTSVNIDHARMEGVESSVTWHPVRWLQLDASYTYTDARDLADDSLLLRRPENQASLDVRLTPLPHLTIVPELLYTGRFADEIVDDAGFPVGVGISRSGVIANLNVTYQMLPKVALFLWARNIGGSRFEPASGYQTPGTSFMAGTRATF